MNGEYLCAENQQYQTDPTQPSLHRGTIIIHYNGAHRFGSLWHAGIHPAHTKRSCGEAAPDGGGKASFVVETASTATSQGAARK